LIFNFQNIIFFTALIRTTCSSRKKEFERDFNELVLRSQATLTSYKVHENHTPTIEVLREQNVKSTIFLAIQMSTIGGREANRKHFTYEKIKAALLALGHGNVERFRDDLKVFFDKHDLSGFMKFVIYYLFKEKQHACARCGCVSRDHMHGAWGFELDHVAQNFRMEGEASTKTASVSDSLARMPLKGVLLEMTQSQLTCVTCHMNLSYKKTKDIEKMVL
jgi:hypothetical protein